eukprot:gene22008-28491_t
MSGINVEAVKEKVNGFLLKYPTIDKPLTNLSEKTKVDKALIALAIAAVPLFLVLSLGFGNFIIDLIGFVYPVYSSIKAIESKDKNDDTQWLTYWLIFGLFKIVEGVADAIISFIPFYFLSKVLFLIWCFYPSTQGASVIYNNFIKPFVVPLIIEAETDKNK